MYRKAAIMEASNDRRTKRTLNAIFDAFIDLMVEEGYEAITVQDIIDRADIGRSTFYLHFKDKDDLLENCIGQLRASLKEKSAASTSCGVGEPYHFCYSLGMLNHVRSHKLLYKAMLTKKGGASVNFLMQRMLSEIVEEEIAQQKLFNGLQLPRSTVVNYIVNTFYTVMTWWMDENMPCSATDSDTLFHKLVFSGLMGLECGR